MTLDCFERNGIVGAVENVIGQKSETMEHKAGWRELLKNTAISSVKTPVVSLREGIPSLFAPICPTWLGPRFTQV